MSLDRNGRRALQAVIEREVSPDDWRANAILMRHVFGHGGFAGQGALIKMAFDDHDILFDPRDDKIGMALLSGRPWQRWVIDRAVAQLRAQGRLKGASAFIDVGANIGTTTIYALRSGYFGHALCLEPEPWNAAILRQNLSLNSLDGAVSIVELAAGAEAADMTLDLDVKNFGRHTLSQNGQTRIGEQRTVCVRPLDTVLDTFELGPDHVGLVKIDVEGHEFAVLAGMAGLLDAGVPVIVEVRGNDPMARLRSAVGPAYSKVVDLDADTAHTADLAADLAVDLAAFSSNAEQSDLLIF